MTTKLSTAILALSAMIVTFEQAGAHVVQFTPTGSVGTRPWPNPTEVTITFNGANASVFETVAPDGTIVGTNAGVTSYADGLIQTTEVEGLLPLRENAQGATILAIDTTSLTVDDVQGADELAVRGGVEGYGSDGFTPCRTVFNGPFAGGCEAAGALDPGRSPCQFRPGPGAGRPGAADLWSRSGRGHADVAAVIALTVALSALLVGLMVWMVVSARRGSALRAETRLLHEADRYSRERLKETRQ